MMAIPHFRNIYAIVSFANFLVPIIAYLYSKSWIEAGILALVIAIIAGFLGGD
jgi:uncharacterized membrane protein